MELRIRERERERESERSPVIDVLGGSLVKEDLLEFERERERERERARDLL